MAGKCDWEIVDGFSSLSEYKRLVAQLDEQVQAGLAKQLSIPAGQGWGTAWQENWYLCQETRETWRLVAPDPPFQGIFKWVASTRR